jgi:outer membrane immunogenic protein
LAGLSDNLPVAVTSLMHGMIGGIQVGYNYQTDAWVLGLEADIQASNQSASYTTSLPVVGNVTAGHRIPYFGTVRRRLGYAFTCGCVMAYATAGLAYGAYEPFVTVGSITVSKTYTNAALTAGAGVEWMIAKGGAPSWKRSTSTLEISAADSLFLSLAKSMRACAARPRASV